MKSLFIFVLSVSGIAFGQDFKHDSSIELFSRMLLSKSVVADISNNNLFQNVDTFHFNNVGEEVTHGLMADSNAKFSHLVVQGSVFILSEDGMPCLVPNLRKVERMPAQKPNNSQNADRMPNAFPKQNSIIPPNK